MVIDRLPRDDGALDTPIVEEFRVGIVSLSWLSDREVVCVELQAVNENSPESEEILSPRE